MTIEAIGTAFPDIVVVVDEMMRKRITVHPCHSNRCSSIGDDCERRLVYERTHWREKKKHDVGLEYIFEVGNLLEKPVMDMLHAAGFNTIRQQEPFEYQSGGELLCTGHIDAILMDRAGVQYVAEVKSMSPHVWDSVNNESDMRKYPWTRKYPPQLHMYMLGLEIPRAAWILVNKSTGRIKQIGTELDYDICESILARCKRINRHVEAGTLPAQLEPTPEYADICTDCPFFHICAPAVNHGGLKLVVDESLASEIDEMQSLEASAKRYSTLKESLKERFEATGTTRAAIGNWLFRKKRVWSDCWRRLED